MGRPNQRAVDRLVGAEGTQILLCGGLSLIVLLGLAANLFLGPTWADPWARTSRTNGCICATNSVPT
jgi:hypothetical protein